MDAIDPIGGSIEAVDQSISNEVVQEPTEEERVIVPSRSMATQTEKKVTQKQLDALARGRTINQERRRKYIEFEKLQKLQALNVIEQKTQPPPSRAVPVHQSYSLSFV